MEQEATHGTNPGGNTVTPGGDNPNPPSGGNSNLTEEEKNKLESNGIKELGKDEITNDNLKDNENIKGVIEGEVPIPTGAEYVEGTKDTGVVVAFGDSEFVWVPVPEISEMAELQDGSNVNYQGIRYYAYSGTLKRNTDAEKPDLLHSATTAVCDTLNELLGTNYTAKSEVVMDLQRDFNEMVASVIKYKGFFIGRYETMLDENKRAHSKKGVIPSIWGDENGGYWYEFYAYQKKMAEDSGLTSVKSHMIWECAYDAMLRWGTTGADSRKVFNSGNAAHDLAGVYESGKETILNNKDRINNVYDLEGNVKEWTMYPTGYKNSYGVWIYYYSLRGGNYKSSGYPTTAFASPDGQTTSAIAGSRMMLYVK